MTRVRDLSVTSVVIQDMFGCPAATLIMVLAGDIHACGNVFMGTNTLNLFDI
jgi:hypothetical protein